MISKHLCSLQNAQPFIFQLICIQLCKCLNCFLKTHNKQLNQYCLYFILFFYPKKVLKNGSGSGQVVDRKLTHKKIDRVTGQPIFASSQKIELELSIVGSGQVKKFWPILPCLVCHHAFRVVAGVKREL